MDRVNRKSNEWIPTNPAYDPAQPMQIGGQAVIEGVMMRAPGCVATALRRADGRISVKQEAYRPLTERSRMLRLPVIRGAVGLIDMLYLGIKTLNLSAEIAALDAGEAKPGKNGDGLPVSPRSARQTLTMLILSLVLALAVGTALFFVVPLVAATYLFDIEQTAVAFNVTAGLVRIAILLSYLAVISLMADIRRVFQYHGAEHKSVFAFELNDPLEVDAARRRSRFHPRCGTSFLLIVMVTAILAFSLLDAILLELTGELTLWQRLAAHLPLIPLIGGVAYEIIKFSARHSAAWWGKILIAPGLWLQSITTKEPDDAQLEVALVALRCALGREDAALYPLSKEASSIAVQTVSPQSKAVE